MDAMGDADELGYDDDLPHREPFLTPETRAIAGAGLVLMSVFSATVFQYGVFLIFESTDGTLTSPATRYLLMAGPIAAMAALGAGLGWSTRNRPMSPGLRGVAGAAVLAGAGMALLIAASIAAGYVWGDDPTQQF